jgi:putative glycosyltransferase (TIGR04372 family)
MPRDGATAFVHAGMAAVHRAWEAAGRAPLLRLRDEHAAALCKACREWGMVNSDRFVCLHVRTAGFYGENREKAQLFRNTSIADYYPLIRALTSMGLWVVRMGDRSMPPLDLGQCGTPQRVVDYALTPQKCGELDVALCANCELFVSSPSGLHTVAHAFGRPVCEVNYPIYNGFPWHPGDIFIPQLYFSRAKGRPLTLQEILGSDLVHHDHQFLLERAGISLIPNEPDDIVETVMEALAPQSYRVRQAALAERVCATFAELNRQHDVGISGRLGRYFAMKHARQLLPAPHPTANDYPGPQPDDDDAPGARANQHSVAEAQA